MIEINKVKALVDAWLVDRDYFLTDILITNDSRIVVEIDHRDGVWIDDCVTLSKHIEAGLDREIEDFELEVGSAGIGQPFKVMQQYVINIGKEVEVLTKTGEKIKGLLVAANHDAFTIEVSTKIKEEGKKKPSLKDVPYTFAYDQVKYTKHVIIFK